jgi:ubiquinone/menaquinone biosynthesis C-methylase UbiE
MDNPMSDLHFRFMSLGYIFRDMIKSPKEKVAEAGINPGFYVLDYGCGPGSYALAAAERVGESGKVYALDIHSLAVQAVQKKASKKGLQNVETILSDCKAGLEDNTIDVVLLYDILHGLDNPQKVLQELHRILKPGGTLSVSDHHMEEEEILSIITKLFNLSKKKERTYTFKS